ncbi:MAG: hypothetical protein V9E94_04110 [Microthrixaceae bacterium]
MALLGSAELTGKMDEAFEQLHRYIRRDVELTRAGAQGADLPAASCWSWRFGVVRDHRHLRDPEVRRVLRVASTPSSRSRRGC